MVKKFDIEEAKNMSDNQIQAIICEGLAEVCDKLANTAKEDKGGKRIFMEKCPSCKRVRKIKRYIKAFDYPKSFRERAEVFRKLAKINRILGKEAK